MTVKHLQTVQQQQLSTAVATDPAVLTKFRSGFSECATEVSRYVSHLENVDPVIKQRLVSHLNNCVNNLQQMAPFYNHYVPYMPERLYPEVKVGFQSDFQNGDENNNGSARIQIPNGVQLIPSRLPTGELALLVPQSAGISANFPFFPPATTDSSLRIGQTSAFTAVQRPHSPVLSPSTSTSSYGDESHHSEHYPQTSSPNHHQPQRRFKLPEQSPASSKSFSSSPETQKPQISSTSDRKSPTTAFAEPKSVNGNFAIRKDAAEGTENTSHISGVTPHSLRQPLSVITDKTYNRAANSLSLKKDDLRKRHADGLLTISEKRPRYQEPTSSTASTNNADSFKNANEKSVAIEDCSEGTNCRAPHLSNPSSNGLSTNLAGSSGANGDMWRPW